MKQIIFMFKATYSLIIWSLFYSPLEVEKFDLYIDVIDPARECRRSASNLDTCLIRFAFFIWRACYDHSDIRCKVTSEYL